MSLRTILLVDDNRTIRSVLTVYLLGLGAEFAEAADGAAALSLLQSRPFDLVISDVHMTPMDGITFVKEVRASPGGREVPIVLMTTDLDDELCRRGLAAGADAFVRKPIGPKPLMHAVEEAMAHRMRASSSAR